MPGAIGNAAQYTPALYHPMFRSLTPMPRAPPPQVGRAQSETHWREEWMTLDRNGLSLHQLGSGAHKSRRAGLRIPLAEVRDRRPSQPPSLQP